MRNISADYTDKLKNTGEAIATLRKAKGLSQADLAEIAGIHTNTVANIENGLGDPSITVLSIVLIRLGCPGITFDKTGFYPSRPDPTQPESIMSDAQLAPAVIASVIGSKIRELRIARGLSLHELADGAKIHPNTVWNIETGLVAPSTFTVYQLYLTLGASSIEAENDTIIIS